MVADQTLQDIHTKAKIFISSQNLLDACSLYMKSPSNPKDNTLSDKVNLCIGFLTDDETKKYLTTLRSLQIVFNSFGYHIEIFPAQLKDLFSQEEKLLQRFRHSSFILFEPTKQIWILVKRQYVRFQQLLCVYYKHNQQAFLIEDRKENTSKITGISNVDPIIHVILGAQFIPKYDLQIKPKNQKMWKSFSLLVQDKTLLSKKSKQVYKNMCKRSQSQEDKVWPRLKMTLIHNIEHLVNQEQQIQQIPSVLIKTDILKKIEPKPKNK